MFRDDDKELCSIPVSLQGRDGVASHRETEHWCGACLVIYSGTSLIRSPMGLGNGDLNGEVTVLQGDKLHCRIQFGTAKG